MRPEREAADELHARVAIEVFMTMLWPAIVLLTAAVVAGLLWPVLYARGQGGAVDRAAYDRAVFRDQLAEIERDAARGAISEADAAAARSEVSRRLLQAAPAAPPVPAPPAAPWAAIVGVLIVPAVALPLYLARGHPGLPGVALAERLAGAVENQDVAAMIAKVERHLAEAPDDARGWTVLAAAYKGERRWDDAAAAYANLLRLEKVSAGRLADYGEMLVYGSEGLVTAEAHRAFAEALRLDPKLPKARFFDALALKQEGRPAAARTALAALLADAPADAGWRAAVEGELRDLDGESSETAAMIRAMVDGLDARLQSDGSDLDGWLRLIRSRTVLAESDRASAALAAARAHFKDRPEALAALDDLARELGL
jgi:cytochrome c-type biogenesis protein CcmH